MSYSRVNNATRADINLPQIFAQGTFKLVYSGTYVNGERQGQRCVAKEFKSGCVYENHYFTEELAIVNRAQKIIDDWNVERVINRKIILNTPEIWEYTHRPTVGGNKRKTLIEPMIENYEKFNSNSGWAASDTNNVWYDAMQALSHFSYHKSSGQFVLCDLQGGIYSDGYILTDPVIMSQMTVGYGPADLGPAGIRSFFARHRCGRFCRSSWIKPSIVVGGALIPMREGTSMTASGRLPMRSTRTPLTWTPKIEE